MFIKIKNYFMLFLSLSLVVPLYSFSGGDGSSGSPFQVSSCDDLQNISNYLSSNFSQINNIDCNIVPHNTGVGFNPIGPIFLGSYIGNNYNISNLFINLSGTYKVGLFKQVDSGAKNISDVNLINVDITGGGRTGALIGMSYLNGEIQNSYVSGKVSGEGQVGGLIGNSYTSIRNSYSNVEVTGTGNHVGGIVGRTWEPIYNSHSIGNVVSVADRVGGIVGDLNSEIYFSYSTGNVTGVNKVGGISGYGTDIRNSYATGNIVGVNFVGGIVGDGWDIHNSYATGNVNSTGNHTGGLAGYVDGTVEDSYATGDVIGINKVGGFVGNADWTLINNSYSTGDVSGVSEVGGFIGFYKYNDTNAFWANSYWNNHSGNVPISVGNGTDYGIISINDNINYFYLSTNEPINSWNSSLWIYSGTDYPTINFNPISTPNSPVLNSVTSLPSFGFGSALVVLGVIFGFLI